MAYISPSLRQMVAERAHYRCEYCLSPEAITGGPMHVEHILPEALGGPTTFDNLGYACARCNIHKGQRTRHRDPVSGRLTPLFNPRNQRWHRHFLWSADGTRAHLVRYGSLPPFFRHCVGGGSLATFTHESVITCILRHCKLTSVSSPIAPARCHQEILAFD